MSFSWIFAIIVGGVIIFGAIYGVTQISRTASTKQSMESSAQFGSILDGLESTIESAKTVQISFPIETRLQNKCDNVPPFGTQGIATQQIINNKWTQTYRPISWENKYIFSSSTVQGKVFEAFTKPFNFPFKVANLIYLTPQNDIYCFKDAPLTVREEISNLNQDNLVLDDCSGANIIVCFNGGQNCNISVDYSGDTVTKDGTAVNFYGDALMYAAIFSDSTTYECQVKRLMQRDSELTQLYLNKAKFISSTCSPPWLSNLASFESATSGYKNSIALSSLGYTSGNLNVLNQNQECKLW